jgi:hypothetical protein
MTRFTSSFGMSSRLLMLAIVIALGYTASPAHAQSRIEGVQSVPQAGTLPQTRQAAAQTRGYHVYLRASQAGANREQRVQDFTLASGAKLRLERSRVVSVKTVSSTEPSLELVVLAQTVQAPGNHGEYILELAPSITAIVQKDDLVKVVMLGEVSLKPIPGLHVSSPSPAHAARLSQEAQRAIAALSASAEQANNEDPALLSALPTLNQQLLIKSQREPLLAEYQEARADLIKRSDALTSQVGGGFADAQQRQRLEQLMADVRQLDERYGAAVRSAYATLPGYQAITDTTPKPLRGSAPDLTQSPLSGVARIRRPTRVFVPDATKPVNLQLKPPFANAQIYTNGSGAKAVATADGGRLEVAAWGLMGRTNEAAAMAGAYITIPEGFKELNVSVRYELDSARLLAFEYGPIGDTVAFLWAKSTLVGVGGSGTGGQREGLRSLLSYGEFRSIEFSGPETANFSHSLRNSNRVGEVLLLVGLSAHGENHSGLGAWIAESKGRVVAVDIELVP